MNAYMMIGSAYLMAMVFAGALLSTRKKGKDAAATSGSRKKIVTYLLINIVMIAAAWLPFQAFAAVLAVIGAFSAYEAAVARQTSGIKEPLLPKLQGFITAASITAITMAAVGGVDKAITLIIGAAVVALSFYKAGNNMLSGSMLMSMIYIPAFLGCISVVRKSDPAGYMASYVYLIVATTDAFAEITGELAGKTKLASKLSPNKTVEGALGGLAAGVAVAMLAGCFMPEIGIIRSLVYGVLISISAQAGDLVASAWKRKAGIKDFSKALGPQGGVLDRFDSFIFSSGMAYLLL